MSREEFVLKVLDVLRDGPGKFDFEAAKEIKSQFESFLRADFVDTLEQEVQERMLLFWKRMRDRPLHIPFSKRDELKTPEELGGYLFDQQELTRDANESVERAIVAQAVVARESQPRELTSIPIVPKYSGPFYRFLEAYLLNGIFGVWVSTDGSTRCELYLNSSHQGASISWVKRGGSHVVGTFVGDDQIGAPKPTKTRNYCERTVATGKMVMDGATARHKLIAEFHFTKTGKIFKRLLKLVPEKKKQKVCHGTFEFAPAKEKKDARLMLGDAKGKIEKKSLMQTAPQDTSKP